MTTAAPETLIPTAKPGLYLMESSKRGTFYQLRNVGTPFAYCDCPAALNHRECRHVISALEQTGILIAKERSSLTTEEKTMAVTLAEKAPAVVRAEIQRLAAASYQEGWPALKMIAADHIATGFAPRDVKTPEQGALILMKALEMDIPITAAYEFIAVINGRPKLMGQMVAALVSRSGKGRIQIVDRSNMGCTAVGYRQGWSPIQIRFTIEDAQRAGLLQKNQNWLQYPGDQCQWKAESRVGRIMFADVLAGMDVIDVGGTILDSVDLGQPEGHEDSKVEILEGTFREVTKDEGGSDSSPAATPAGGEAVAPPAPASPPGQDTADPPGPAEGEGDSAPGETPVAAENPSLFGDDALTEDTVLDRLMPLLDAAGLTLGEVSTHVIHKQANPRNVLAFLREVPMTLEGLVAATKSKAKAAKK